MNLLIKFVLEYSDLLEDIKKEITTAFESSKTAMATTIKAEIQFELSE